MLCLTDSTVETSGILKMSLTNNMQTEFNNRLQVCHKQLFKDSHFKILLSAGVTFELSFYL